MPFQSKSQMRACYAQMSRDKKAGRKSKWNCHKWAHETRNIRNLPEYKYTKRKSSKQKSRRRSNTHKSKRRRTRK